MNSKTSQAANRLITGFVCCALLAAATVWGADQTPVAAQPGVTATQPAKRELNVLFIGNSMTWFHNMPRTVAELAAQMSPSVQVNIVLSCQACNTTTGHAREGSPTRNAIAYNSGKGGAGNLLGMVDHQNYCFQPALTISWLEQLLAKEPGNEQCKEDLLFLQKRMDSIKSQSDPRWDVVVIQPWEKPDVQQISTNVRTLQDDIAKVAPGAKAILYMDVSGVDRDNSVQTHKRISEEMAVYRQLALSNGVTVAPAALTCLHVNGEKPEYWLKDPKGAGDVHPGLRGSYAIACSIFTAIFDRSPVGLPVRRMESHFQIDTKVKDANGKPSLNKTYVWGTEHNAALDDRNMRLMQDKAWQAWQEWKDYLVFQDLLGRTPETDRGKFLLTTIKDPALSFRRGEAIRLAAALKPQPAGLEEWVLEQAAIGDPACMINLTAVVDIHVGGGKNRAMLSKVLAQALAAGKNSFLAVDRLIGISGYNKEPKTEEIVTFLTAMVGSSDPDQVVQAIDLWRRLLGTSVSPSVCNRGVTALVSVVEGEHAPSLRRFAVEVLGQQKAAGKSALDALRKAADSADKALAAAAAAAINAIAPPASPVEAISPDGKILDQ